MTFSPKNGFVDEDALFRPSVKHPAAARAEEEIEEEDNNNNDDDASSVSSKDFYETEPPLDYPSLRIKLSSLGDPPHSIPGRTVVLPICATSIEGVQELSVRSLDTQVLLNLIPNQEVRNGVLRFCTARDVRSNNGRLLTPLTLDSHRLLPLHSKGQTTKPTTWQIMKTGFINLIDFISYSFKREILRFQHNLIILDTMYAREPTEEPLRNWVDPPNSKKENKVYQKKVSKTSYPIPAKGVLVKLEYLNRDLSAVGCRAMIGSQVRQTPGSLILTHFLQIDSLNAIEEGEGLSTPFSSISTTNECRLRHLSLDFYEGKVLSDLVFSLSEFGIVVDISRKEKKQGKSLLSRFWATSFRSHFGGDKDSDEEAGAGRGRRNSDVHAIREEDEDGEEEDAVIPQ